MIKSQQNFDLSEHNTFAMPVKCGCFMEYDSREDIPFVLSTIRPDIDIFHIGAGSNLLFTSDFQGVVLHSLIRGMEIVATGPDHVLVRVGAGETMDSFIEWACRRELWGVENLSGIPGEAGAAAVQNVGAYGAEAADAIESVEAFDRSQGEFVIIPKAECSYAYRDSLFKRPSLKGSYIISSVTFRLSTIARPNTGYSALAGMFAGRQPESPMEVRKAVIAIRDSKLPDPAKVPSAGSFFKNPEVERSVFDSIAAAEGGEERVPHYMLADGRVKIPAAWLIDRCGWKGFEEGNVAVWHLQPLVIVNPHRKATPHEVVSLEKRIAESVKSRFGITLVPEVEHI